MRWQSPQVTACREDSATEPTAVARAEAEKWLLEFTLSGK